MQERRVAAVCFPELLAELGGLGDGRTGFVGFILREKASMGAQAGAHAVLHHASMEARAMGVCAGMTVAAARGLCPMLQLQMVETGGVVSALEQLAEICMDLSPVVALEPLDALLLDGTGAGLFGGESRWARIVQRRMADNGHMARVAVAPGPDVALAVSRHSAQELSFIPRGRQQRHLDPLPVMALGFSRDHVHWLQMAGLGCVADVRRQPRAPLARRLGKESRRLRLLDVDGDPGADARPLKPYQPAPSFRQELDMNDHPTRELEPLSFWLKRASDRLGARLRGQQRSARHLRLTLHHGPQTPPTVVNLPLALPLQRPSDWLAALRPCLEQLALPAEVTGMCLEVPYSVSCPPEQLSHLPREGMPQEVHARLWAELRAEVGHSNVGRLVVRNTHQPELATRLLEPDQAWVPPGSRKEPPPAPAQTHVFPGLDSTEWPLAQGPTLPAPHVRGEQDSWHVCAGLSPLRVLPTPVPLPGWPVKEQPLGPGLARVIRIQQARKLWSCWWSEPALVRDYLEVQLDSGEVAWVFLESKSGEVFLQGWMD